MKFEWEVIANWPKSTVARVKVYGGWIVRDTLYYDKEIKRELCPSSLIFIPDPEHKWEITNE